MVSIHLHFYMTAQASTKISGPAQRTLIFIASASASNPCTCRIPITCYWVVFFLFWRAMVGMKFISSIILPTQKGYKSPTFNQHQKMIRWFLSKESLLGAQHHGFSRRWKPWRRWRWVKLPKARVGCQWCQLENRMVRFSVSRNETTSNWLWRKTWEWVLFVLLIRRWDVSFGWLMF